MSSPLEHPGTLGVWATPDGMSAAECVGFAKTIEDLGYSAWWLPEAVGRDPLALIGYLGAQTNRLIFSTGIANIYARDLHLIKSIHQTISEFLPGRFILGLGVSHPHLVTRLRGHEWEKPVAKMRSVLQGLPDALYHGPRPEFDAPIVIAALRPLMLKLAAEECRGAHPYLVTPEHTKIARGILGTGPWLCPEQMVIHETDATTARELARRHLKVYLRAPNYQNNLLELGFTADDWQDWNASDGLVDALVAWGDRDAIQQRIQGHWDAGADHVAIQAFRPDGSPKPDLEALKALAPA